MVIKKLFSSVSHEKLADYAWLFIRLALAIVLVMHGFQKLNGGIPMFAGFVGKLGFPQPMAWAWFIALLEFVGGLAIALGLWTRDLAAILAIQFLIIIVAVKKVAFPAADTDLLVFGAVIALMLNGAGRLSLDAKMKKQTQ
jgi:putative oxidoreductase